MTAPTSLRVVIVLYENPLDEIRRCLRALHRTTQLACADSTLQVSSVTISLGDCSARPTIAEDDLISLLEPADPRIRIQYQWFDANLGHSGGSNALADGAPEEALLFLNPDCYPSPTMLSALLGTLDEGAVAAADGRQIPCEHPKYFDPITGDQSWASGACLIIRANVFRELGGFDQESFPSYVNDVDLSWRIRLAGFRVVHQPKAVVFYDKRLNPQGQVQPTATESYEGGLGRLMLAIKFARPDIVAMTLESLKRRESNVAHRVLLEFERRREAGRLPASIVDAAKVAEFTADEYGARRF